MRRCADWSAVDRVADVTVHHGKLRGEALLAAIGEADAIAVVRDRTPFKADLLAQLPKLRYLVYTGVRNTQLDAAAFAARGIPVSHTEKDPGKDSTCEHTWALILAASRRLEAGMALVREGRWRDGGPLAAILRGERLGLVGFGEIGQRVGQVGKAFGMEVVTWSPHMTAGAGGRGRGDGGEPRGAPRHLEGGEPAPRALGGDAQAPRRDAAGGDAPGRDPGEHLALDAHRHGGAARGARRRSPGARRAGRLRRGAAARRASPWRSTRTRCSRRTWGSWRSRSTRSSRSGMVECLEAWLAGKPLVRVLPA